MPSFRLSLLLLAATTSLAGAVPPAPQVALNQAVLRETLANGLQVVIVPNRLAPVVTTEINYLAGSNDAPDGFPGTAHALEHMMFRGAEGLDRDQLSELGSLLGGSYNADTTESVTQYFYTAPADDLAVALRIEAGRMRGLSLKQADWEQERGAIEQEVSRDFSSPIYTYLSQLQAIMFAGTPYEHDALGTRPSFDKTDSALLRSFYDRWYAPNNAILVVAGDVEPHAAMKQVEAAFGGICTPRSARPSQPCRKPGATEDAGTAYGFSRRADHAGLSLARPEGPRFCRGRYSGGRAGQRARRAVPARARGSRAALAVRQPAEGGCGLRACRSGVSERRGPEAAAGRGARRDGVDRQRRGAARPGGGGASPGTGSACVHERQHQRACGVLVPRPGLPGPEHAGGCGRRIQGGDAGGCEPAGEAAARPEPVRDRDPDAAGGEEACRRQGFRRRGVLRRRAGQAGGAACLGAGRVGGLASAGSGNAA